MSNIPIQVGNSDARFRKRRIRRGGIGNSFAFQRTGFEVPHVSHGLRGGSGPVSTRSGRGRGSGQRGGYLNYTLHNNGVPLPPVPPVQVPPVQVPPIQVSLPPVTPVQVPPGQVSPAQVQPVQVPPAVELSKGQQRQQQNSPASSTSPAKTLSQGPTISPEAPPSATMPHNTAESATGAGDAAPGEHPTIIQRARPYITEEQIQDVKPDDPGWETRDVGMRLNGCQWILGVGGILQFPIRTMATAMILFHRFKLFHPKWEHSYTDCAAAALFLACKIEDTLKKSREILAAGHSLRHGSGNSEAISPDSPVLEDAARRTLVLERIILESSSFDFRNRHSQPFLIKFCRKLGIEKATAQLAWDISIDCYRTLSPLKATPHVQAMAALTLAQKLAKGVNVDIKYEDFETKEEDVLDVVKDLLDLYTHHRNFTTVGERYSPEIFITIRIALNKASEPSNGSHTNGKAKEKNVNVLAPGLTGLSEKDKMAIGESVRFMLDGERERNERMGGAPVSGAPIDEAEG